MKICSVEIKNFRAISSFKEEIGSYTTLIGYNGGGKSSILHAIRWFFDDFTLSPTDIFNPTSEVKETELPEVKVTLVFDELNAEDRNNFGPYATGNTMTLSRIGGENSKSKLFGEKFVNEEFQEARAESSVPARRKSVLALSKQAKFSTLQIDSKSNKDKLEEEMTRWENDPANYDHVSKIEDDQANHFFGAVGSDKLKIDSGFVFIPAAPDLTGEFDSTGKGTALQLLLGDILKGSIASSIETWTKNNREVLNELESIVETTSADDLAARAQQVNRHLGSYLPGAEIKFSAGLQDWAPKASPVAQSVLKRDDRELLLESEGHGVQRATLLALLQATADARSQSKESEVVNPEQNGSEHTSLSDISTPSTPSSSLIVCIEEPEVYQHPVQARLMARSLFQASNTGDVQFILATHSPYFLEPTRIQDILRVSNHQTGSKIHRPGTQAEMKTKIQSGEMDKYFLESVIECLFSRAALVVEGDTERAIFDALPIDESGTTLRDLGVSIAVSGGAGTLVDMANLIHTFGVPTYIVRDGDSDEDIALEKARGKERNRIKNEFGCDPDIANPAHLKILGTRKEATLKSWRSDVEKFVGQAISSGFGDDLKSFTWGSGCFVGSSVTILRHDLETELHQWKSFMDHALNEGIKGDLRNEKKAGRLSRIAAAASAEDLPRDLKELLKAVATRASA